MRVISLLASGTEIVCALGAGDALVGRSHECDNPEWVRKLPACTSPAFDVSMSSGKIDAEVRRRLKLHKPLYHVDADLIRELHPDLLITQAHCEVCAVTPEDVERVGCGILSSQVLALSAGTVEGIFDGVMSIARGMNLLPAGEDLVAKMRSGIRAVTDAVREKPAPTVVMLEWIDPIFSMGNWGPELLEALPGWSQLKSVRAGRVALADGNLYFNRSGTTIVETVEIIAEILHGRGGADKRQAGAWQPYADAALGVSDL